MNRSTVTCPSQAFSNRMSSLPMKTHISYKEKERNLLLMEEELMDHYNMNRSDLHKHFIRTHYQMLKAPQAVWR
jgi:acetyl-CoA acetyltransferase